jgi:tRNA pseudouridine(38-40) synthase
MLKIIFNKRVVTFLSDLSQALPGVKRRTFRIGLAYDGAAFAGFQKQPGIQTVEGTLIEALRPILPSLKGLAVGGRTDRGVHATGQVASFWTLRPLDPGEVAARISAAMPGALEATEVRLVPPSFHAQFSAVGRRYVYQFEGQLDPRRLRRLLQPLLGTRSFTAFARDTPPGTTTVRRLLEADVRAVDVDGRSMLRFDFAATGFLRRQIRVMVATAVREAEAAAPDDALLRMCDAGDRRATAWPAPPEGLTLTRIAYEPRRT